jgi:hypothetical protein
VETAAQPHLPASAGAPVGTIRAKTVALFSAARLGGTEHGAAYFLRVIGQCLQTHCAGAHQIDKAALHIGTVALIHRFGSNSNQHVHFMVARWSACRDRWTSWKRVFVTVSCIRAVRQHLNRALLNVWFAPLISQPWNSALSRTASVRQPPVSDSNRCTRVDYIAALCDRNGHEGACDEYLRLLSRPLAAVSSGVEPVRQQPGHQFQLGVGAVP